MDEFFSNADILGLSLKFQMREDLKEAVDGFRDIDMRIAILNTYKEICDELLEEYKKEMR